MSRDRPDTSAAIVLDSANTGSAWATPNKTYLNAVSVFTDDTDCPGRFNGQLNAATLQYIQDNPRVGNLWQYYMKRRLGYQTGLSSR